MLTIRNNQGNFSTEDVWMCENLVTLYKWQTIAHETYFDIYIKLMKAQAKVASGGNFMKREEYSKLSSARKLQEILILQIKERIKFLERQNENIIEICKSKFSPEEWDEIVAQANLNHSHN